MTDAPRALPESAPPPPDLTSCDREPIHLLGQVQPWGFLLAANARQVICHASANVAEHLGQPADAVLGQALDTLLLGPALHEITSRLQTLQGQDHTDRVFGLALLAGRPNYDVALHWTPGDDRGFVLEAELSAAEPGFDAVATVKGMMARLLQAKSLDDLHERAARQIRNLLGFERVMVYRFAPDGSGEVVGEATASGLESFRGLHYPASDIPTQARALYCRNWLRLIADIAAPTVPILPAPRPGEAPLDLSSSILRSVSPVHIEYLGNMGVVASLSISIMRGNQLWGLLACHHGQALLPNFPRRSAAELFGQLYSFQVESLERAAETRNAEAARALQERVLDSLSDKDDLGSNLQRIAAAVRSLLPCDGVAIHNVGRIESVGSTPDPAMIEAIVGALDLAEPAPIVATTELARLHPPAAAQAELAVGMLAIRISRTPRDYLMFFRREAIHTVTWAGDPTKPAEPLTMRQSPRLSFAAWQQTMRGQSAPWLDAELHAAGALRVGLLEVVVRLLSSAAATQASVAKGQQELLIAELNHRVRNILALIAALVSRSRTSAGTLESFVTALNGRIQSLARAHDQLTEDRWGPVPLRGMIESEFHAYLGDGQQARTRLSGPPVLVEPHALTVLALVVHELVTNAAKYGALSNGHGVIDLRWQMEADGGLVIAWRESGGPPVSPPSRTGFGTTVVQRTIPFELQGRAAVRYLPDGLEADFTIPARFVHLGEAAALSLPAPARPTPLLSFTGTAMVLEDSALLAMDAEDILRAIGFQTVEVVGTAAAALDLLDRIGSGLSFALLDVNLSDHTSLPVAEELLRRGIPFAFATGYGKALELPPALAAAAMVIPKPYRRQDIAELIGHTLRRQ